MKYKEKMFVELKGLDERETLIKNKSELAGGYEER